MKKFSILRIIATALVLFSLFLPLSRCERKPIVLKDGKITIVEKNGPVTFSYHYPRDWFVLTEWQGWLALFTFSWPLMMLLIRWRSRKIREFQATQWVEIILCLGSGYMIWKLSSIGERLSGAYVALSGIGLYLIAAVKDSIRSVLRHFQIRETEHVNEADP
jgi:hypothetical protein